MTIKEFKFLWVTDLKFFIYGFWLCGFDGF